VYASRRIRDRGNFDISEQRMSRNLFAAALICASILCAADVRTGTYRGHPVRFENVQGVALYQGDIILGNTAELEADAPAEGKSRQSSVLPSTRSLWPDGTIPYVIDPALSTVLQQRVNDAIAHWNSNTPIKLVQHGTEANYVRFTTATGTTACSSSVGMIGGQQMIRLPGTCSTGAIIHEIGHAVGFWHEQERLDRNQFTTVLYENIDKQSAFNYDQAFASGQDLGPYNFNSIMHYGAFDFSKQSGLTAMETVPAGIPIGQRTGLSYGDLDTVRRLYGQTPSRTTIATTPSGLKISVDGALVDDGTSFDWAPGSTHTIAAPFQGNDSTRYLFGSWSDGGDATHSITVSADRTIYIANFIRQHNIMAAASPAAGGAVALRPSPADHFYTERSYVQLQASPAAGYNFYTWNLTQSAGDTSPWLLVMAPGTAVGTFTTKAVTTIASQPAGRTVIVDGRASVAPVSFLWAAGEPHTLDVDTAQPSFTHYQFTEWSDGGAQQHTIQASGKAQTLTARFTTQYSLAMGTLRNGTIAIDPPSPDGFYSEGTTVQLTASPSTGSVLLGWAGDLGGASNPASVVMDDQKLVNVSFGPATQIPAITAVSAASGTVSAVSAGEIVVIYGANLGPSTLIRLQVSGGKVATSLAGTQVLFDGIAAPLIYTSSKQVSAVVPYGIVAPRLSTLVQVRYNAQLTAPVRITVAESQPALFTVDQSGKNSAAALNQDGSVNSPSNPAASGQVIVLYATGEGATSPAGVDGQVAASVYPKPVLPVSVRIGGRSAVVQYAGAAPGLVAGVMQINAVIPDGIQAGPKVPVHVVVGPGISPPGVTIAVE
jgi:uncharacterized protein (TIGR03437 family)